MVLLVGLSACGAAPTAVTPSQTPPPPVLTRLPTRTLSPETNTGSITPGVILTPTPTVQVHVVQKDELGSTIALRYGISLAQMQAANPGVDLNYLKEGSELYIPPRSETPSAELFTPTPVTLIYGEPHCYPTGQGNGWCLINVKNPQDRPVFYLTGEFLVQNGDTVFSQKATGLADILPAGSEMPLIAYFDSPFAYPLQVRFSPVTAFQAESPRVQSLAAENIQVALEPNGLWADVKMTVHATAAAAQPAVVLCAYAGETPAGIRRIELNQALAADGRVDFSDRVFTTGPRIDRVIVYAESRED